MDEILADEKKNRDHEAGEEVDVVANTNTDNDKKVGMSRKKKCGFFAMFFLLVDGAVSAALGMTLGKNNGLRSMPLLAMIQHRMDTVLHLKRVKGTHPEW